MDSPRRWILREWERDEGGEALHTLAVWSDGGVSMGSGRYAQGSGGRTCGWSDFPTPEMARVIEHYLGAAVLEEAVTYLDRIRSGAESPSQPKRGS